MLKQEERPGFSQKINRKNVECIEKMRKKQENIEK